MPSGAASRSPRPSCDEVATRPVRHERLRRTVRHHGLSGAPSTAHSESHLRVSYELHLVRYDSSPVCRVYSIVASVLGLHDANTNIAIME